MSVVHIMKVTESMMLVVHIMTVTESMINVSGTHNESNRVNDKCKWYT